MKPMNPYKTVAKIMAGVLCLAVSGCRSGSDDPSPASKMSVNFRVETRSGEQAASADGDDAAGYEAATDWENFIDIKNTDYRIGFFDFDNVCITPFTPTSVMAVQKNTYTDYTLEGKVPGVLTLYANFKIVVLANWKEYPEMTPGVTTLDDLCCPNRGSGTVGKFEKFSGTGFNVTTAERFVPMYGVKEYKGVTFGKDNKDNPTVLYEGSFGPINMLRAIAKVEVVFDTTDPYELDETQNICITNYNDNGFCAPEGAYTEEDYYHKDWATDFWQGFLHLPGGHNDGTAKTPLAMTKTTNAAGKTVYVAYLPEYRNVAHAAASHTDCGNAGYDADSTQEVVKARIAVPLTRGTSYIDFATYSDGEPDTYFNIERNNLYRFTITHVDPGVKWKVEAMPWRGILHEEIVM